MSKKRPSKIKFSKVYEWNRPDYIDIRNLSTRIIFRSATAFLIDTYRSPVKWDMGVIIDCRDDAKTRIIFKPDKTNRWIVKYRHFTGYHPPVLTTDEPVVLALAEYVVLAYFKKTDVMNTSLGHMVAWHKLLKLIGCSDQVNVSTGIVPQKLQALADELKLGKVPNAHSG